MIIIAYISNFRGRSDIKDHGNIIKTQNLDLLIDLTVDCFNHKTNRKTSNQL